jgi:CBS domain-containing protein
VAMQALFILNILLGLFNLLPWLPLDGGRALRSYLQRKRSFLDATRLAVKCSNIVTVLFVVGTIIYAALIPGYSFAYREFIVLIDMIVAFFIYGGAQAELQGAIVKDNISDLRTKDVMVKNYVMLKGDAKVSDLYKTLMAKRSSIVLFMKGDRVMMVFHTALQKLLKNPTPEGSIENLGVEIPVVKANSALYNAIDKMRLDESGVAAVTNGKKIVGVLLSQHIESVVALHMSQRRNAKDAQQRK